MSWLFGIKRDPVPMSDAFPVSSEGDAGGSTTPPPGDDKSKRKQMETYSFDSSALERAAQAARELERSSKIFF